MSLSIERKRPVVIGRRETDFKDRNKRDFRAAADADGYAAVMQPACDVLQLIYPGGAPPPMGAGGVHGNMRVASDIDARTMKLQQLLTAHSVTKQHDP